MQDGNIQILAGSQKSLSLMKTPFTTMGLDDEEDDGWRIFLYRGFEPLIEPTHSFGHHIENADDCAAPHRVQYPHCRGS